MTPRADIVLAAGDLPALVTAVDRGCGDSRGSIFAVVDDPNDAAPLRDLQETVRELFVLCSGAPASPVVSCNRGLLLRMRDVVVARGAPVRDGWLKQALEVFGGSDRIASVQEGPCVLLRHWVLDAAGCLDPSFTDLDRALDDWCRRAERLGLLHVRAPDVKPEAFRVTWPSLDARRVAEVLRDPRPLVLEIAEWGDPSEASRALLFALAQSAQAIVADRGLNRSQLAAELALPAESIELAPTDPAERAGHLASILERAAASPPALTLRRRQLVSDFAFA